MSVLCAMRRWDFASSGGVAWGGHQVQAVRIGACGRFPYVLVKLVDHAAGLSKLLIRGKNFATEGQLVQALRDEVQHMAICANCLLLRVSVSGCLRHSASSLPYPCILHIACYSVEGG